MFLPAEVIRKQLPHYARRVFRSNFSLASPSARVVAAAKCERVSCVLTCRCLCVSPQEQEDLALAQALAASEEEYRRQQQRQQVPGKLSRH